MHFSNFSNLPSVVFMLLMVIAGATGLFTCARSHYGYCVFEDRLTIPINYAFGPAFAPQSSTTKNLLSLTCDHSRLPVGTPKGTCCDRSVGDVFFRSDDDPLIVYYDDYNKHGCHEASNTK
ncbi:hypothetical protein PGTUg99_015155 [Puccinia graminis f. sp. tritici]|uniref:Uncharacterized protein n=1 Tax=Puccinia graminis f. sp. tritici TaxID=56615 RepID=A0A5B0MPJ5_PUCGR|nr:hypothetical protein PGTUg99_015155 [Puccinia graminis f. sp. tritici]